VKLDMQRFHTLKVLVAIPSTGLWFADFGTSLTFMIGFCAQKKIMNYKDQEIRTLNMKGSILSKSRFLCVEEAKKLNVDYLLFIDSDQTFPKSTIHGLVARNKDVIGANVATKQLPSQPTARNKGANFAQDPQDWVPVYTDEGSTGVEKVDRVGCGVLMLSKKAYLALEPQDWNTYWRPEIETFQGEDWTMMDAIEAKGFDVWIDHDFSQFVGHVGFFTFTHAEVGTILSPEEYKKLEEIRRVRNPQSRAIAEAIATM
jgi:hypothetical protein